jgi:hypothetical protein
VRATLVLLLLLSLGLLGAGVPELALPEGVSARWVIEPSEGDRGADVSFAVDPKGTVWLGVGNMAFAPTRNILFRADRQIDQLLWLGDLQLVRSGAVLGRLEPLEDPPRGMPKVHLTPLTEIPLSSWRMAAAGSGDICIAGYNPHKQVSQIALLGPRAGRSGIRVLYETEAQISDVACDEKSTYFAAGGTVWKVAGTGRPAEVFHAQPQRAVRRIALNPDGGLFYVTAETVGYAGENARFDFMRCSRCQLAVAKDSLYILKDRVSGGVLRLEEVGEFSRLRL